MKTTYSRKELYALGEPLGESSTVRKIDGTYLCGGGGGGVIAAVAAVVTVAAAVATDGFSLIADAGAAVDSGAAAATDAAASGATAAEVIGGQAGAASGTALPALEAESSTAAAAANAANSLNTDQLLSQIGSGALKGAASSGLRDVITGNTDNLMNDLALGAVTGGAGAGVGNLATQELGANPIVSGALSGGTSAGLSAGITGSPNILKSIGTGAISGGAGGASQMISQANGLTPLESGALKGAVSGGTSAAIRGGNILNNAIIGGAGGAAGSAVGNEVTQNTGSKLLGSVLGGVAGYEGSNLASQAINGAPTVPQTPTVAAGGSRTGANMASGTPTANAYGNPTAAQTRSNLGGQTGIPNEAETSGGVSDVSLAGNTQGAGILSGSNPVMNTGSATNNAPTSGLNSAGLPAPLSPGVLTSQVPTLNATQSQTAQNLAQLYPELDPRIVNILASTAGTQPKNYKKGGQVHMVEGGDATLMAKLQAIESRNRSNTADAAFQAAMHQLGPQTQYAAKVPFGNPAGNYNKPITPGFFVTHAKKGGHMQHDEHVPEFITGATGHYVKGKGDGQSDDIPAMLADGEYVFDADTVASLGNGSSDAGAKLLDHFREALREHKRSATPDKIPPKASPLAYMKEALKKHTKG